LDGDVRRGTHVLKALALGAKAVMIGRPYIYGVTAGGQQGVAKVLSIFRDELARDCQLLGAASRAEVGPEIISVSREARIGEASDRLFDASHPG